MEPFPCTATRPCPHPLRPALEALVVAALALAACSGGEDRTGEDGRGGRGRADSGTVPDSGPAPDSGDGGDTGPRRNHPYAPAGLVGRTVTGLAMVPSEAADSGQALWAATREAGLQLSLDDGKTWSEVLRLPDTDVLAFDADADGRVLHAALGGEGIFASSDGGETWNVENDGLVPPDFPGAASSPSRLLPRRLVRLDGRLHLLAQGGGLYRERDGRDGWDLVAGPAELGASGLLPLDAAFVPVEAGAGAGLYLAVGDLSPITPSPEGTPGGPSPTLFHRAAAGGAWTPVTAGLPAGRRVTALAVLGQTLLVGTMGGGVFRLRPGAEALEPAGSLEDPSVVGLFALPGGRGVLASTAMGRLYGSRDGHDFLEVGGSMAAAPVLCVAAHPRDPRRGFVGTAGDGVFGSEDLLAGSPGDHPEPPVTEGRVHLLLSVQVNLYRADRGDATEPEGDGFGRDLAGLRSFLGFLDRHPDVRVSWVSDTAFTLDDRLRNHAPDLLDRIRTRVRERRDEVRRTFWSGGLAGAENDAEFRSSVTRSEPAHARAFGREYLTRGFHPSGGFLSPDHLKVYKETGIEWLTYSYSATPGSGLRGEVWLDPKARFNPVTVEDPAGETTLKLVPLYRLEDVVDHGGLLSWVEAIHRETPRDDAFLVLHGEAGDPAWSAFEGEVSALEAAGLDNVLWSGVEDYLLTHRPVARFTLARDLAEGSFDGYASFAEKLLDRDLWTAVDRSRLHEDAVRGILRTMAGEARARAEQALEQVRDDRQRLLAAAHFGPAAPAIHPDRERAARELAARIEAASRRTFDEVVATRYTPEAGTFLAVNPTPGQTDALVRIEAEFGPGSFRAESIRLFADGQEVPGTPTSPTLHPDGSIARCTYFASVPMAGGQVKRLEFRPGEGVPRYGNRTEATPRRLTNGMVTVTFDDTGYPVEVRMDRRGREVVVGDWEFLQPSLVFEGRTVGVDAFTLSVEPGDEGSRGHLAQVRARAEVPVGGGTWRLSYTYRVVRLLPFLFVDVDVEYPYTGTVPDPRLTEAIPLGIRPKMPPPTYDHDGDPETEEVPRLPITSYQVWRETGRGSVLPYPVEAALDAVNNHAAAGWMSVFGLLLAFDRTTRSSPAFCPLRFEKASGGDVRPVLNPFGTFDGDQPAHFPYRTGGIGAAEVLGLLRRGPDYGPSAPSLAGARERFTLAIAAVATDERPDNPTVDLARAIANPPLLWTGERSD